MEWSAPAAGPAAEKAYKRTGSIDCYQVPGGSGANLLPGLPGHHGVLGEAAVAAAAGLQRYWLHSEMLQHVEHGGEPEVLYPALPVRGEC